MRQEMLPKIKSLLEHNMHQGRIMDPNKGKQLILLTHDNQEITVEQCKNNLK